MEVARLYEFIILISEAKSQEELKFICSKFCDWLNTPWYLMGVITLK